MIENWNDEGADGGREEENDRNGNGFRHGSVRRRIRRNVYDDSRISRFEKSNETGRGRGGRIGSRGRQSEKPQAAVGALQRYGARVPKKAHATVANGAGPGHTHLMTGPRIWLVHEWKRLDMLRRRRRNDNNRTGRVGRRNARATVYTHTLGVRERVSGTSAHNAFRTMTVRARNRSASHASTQQRYHHPNHRRPVIGTRQIGSLRRLLAVRRRSTPLVRSFAADRGRRPCERAMRCRDDRGRGAEERVSERKRERKTIIKRRRERVRRRVTLRIGATPPRDLPPISPVRDTKTRQPPPPRLKCVRETYCFWVICLLSVYLFFAPERKMGFFF